MFILTVKELFANIKVNLERLFPFVVVKGIATDLRFCKYNNLYFTLKEGDTTINCVCWYSKFKKLKINPTEIDLKDKEVTIKGYISVYNTSTKISITVIDILLQQEAEYRLLLDKKEAQLREEGYFNPENKKPLPSWPNIIGIITSSESRAKEDFIISLTKRFSAKILLYNSCVQGKNAPSDIINAITYFNNIDSNIKPKVLLITRGGGSGEDLEAFNDEELVKSIFYSKIPIVTAIGHTRDISLADYAADKYAITPTDAANIIAPITIQEYKNKIKHLIDNLYYKVKRKIKFYYSQCYFLKTKLVHPNEYIKEQTSSTQILKKQLITLLKENYNKNFFQLKELANQINNIMVYTIKTKTHLLINTKFQPNFYKENILKNQKNLVLCYQTLNNNINACFKKLYQKIEYQHLKIRTYAPNLPLKKEKLLFLTTTFFNQIKNILNDKVKSYNYLNTLLDSLSYKNTLKRGYTFIKNINTNSIVKRSTELANQNTFEIVFYDKTIKVTKK